MSDGFDGKSLVHQLCGQKWPLASGIIAGAAVLRRLQQSYVRRWLAIQAGFGMLAAGFALLALSA